MNFDSPPTRSEIIRMRWHNLRARHNCQNPANMCSCNGGWRSRQAAATGKTYREIAVDWMIKHPIRSWLHRLHKRDWSR